MSDAKLDLALDLDKGRQTMTKFKGSSVQRLKQL